MQLINFLNDIIYESELIKQGGNAFPNVQRINRSDIQITINNFINEILYPTFFITPNSKEIFTTGSTGKKPDSGDIDIALNINFIKKPVKQIIQKLFTYTKLYTNVPVILNTFEQEMIQFAYPINNSDKLVQIDLLLTQYPVFTKWYTLAPTPNESKYKSAHKNSIIRAIIKTFTYRPLKTIKNKDVMWETEDINPFGLYKQTKTIIDEFGNPLKYKETDEDLLPEFAKTLKSTQISHSPLFVTKKYLGNYNPNNIKSFETVFSIITSKNYKFKNDVEDILYYTAQFIKENKNLEFPTELEQYI